MSDNRENLTPERRDGFAAGAAFCCGFWGAIVLLMLAIMSRSSLALDVVRPEPLRRPCSLSLITLNFGAFVVFCSSSSATC